MLAACVTAGWDPGGYLRPDHPLQLRIGDVLAEILGEDPGSPGIDGCGAPVWTASVAGIAGAYARLAADERFAAVRQAMASYPLLVSGEARLDGSIGRWTGGVAKGGAAGCMGAAVAGHGIASKAWSGSGAVAAMGVALGVDWLGMLTPAVRSGLADVISPPVFGGGAVVGRIRPSAVLEPV